MSSLTTQVFTYMGQFLTDYKSMFAIPIGVVAFGLVLTVVIGAIRNR